VCIKVISILRADRFPLQPPPNFQQIYRTHNRIHVNWSPVTITTNEDLIGYQLSITLREQDGVDFVNTPLTVKVTEMLPLSVLEYQFLFLDANSKYEISVYAVNENGNGIKSTISKLKCGKKPRFFIRF
jgi:Fibronectin type III domain.